MSNLEAGLSADRRLPILDGWRGIAILSVLFYHQTHLIPISGMDRIFAKTLSYGWMGVDLFFVISGFLITGILLDTRNKSSYFKSFYIRRALRIWPLYYAVVIAALLVLPHLPLEKVNIGARLNGDEWWYWINCSNIPIALSGLWRHPVLDVCWSLALEEQFYLIWPLLVLFLNKRALTWFLLAVIVGSILMRGVLLYAGAAPIAVYVLPFCRFDAMAAGSLAAIYFRTDGFERQAGNLLKIGLFSMLATLILILTAAPCSQFVSMYDRNMQIAGYTFIALGFSSLLLYSMCLDQNSLFARIVGSSSLRVVGKYSFALYLFHLPLRALIRDKIFRPEQFGLGIDQPILGQILFYGGSTALTLGCAWVSWHLFEKYFIGFKKHFPAR